MKPRINIIVIFVLLFILAENVLAQNVFGPQGPNYIREIIKTGPENGSGPVVSYLQLLNGTCIIGKSTVNNETNFGRAIIQWNIPDNIIPDNSTINSVRLYLTYTKNGHSIELDAQFSSLPLDIQNLTQAQNEQLWQLMSTTGIGYKTGVNNVLEFISNNPNDDFNLAVKNALVNDRFVLGIRVSVPSNVTELTWTIQNPSITLRIEFTPPTQQVIVDQKLPDNTSIDSVGLYNFSQTRFDKFSVPQTFLWDVGSNKTLQGSQKLLNYNKYLSWLNEPDVINHRTINIEPSTNFLTSQFNPTQNLIKIQNSLEGTTLEGGKVEFADPWFVDYPDPNFPKPGGGYYERNRGMKQSGPDALVYYERNSPFSPNWFSPYDGRQYKGVFLNQSGPGSGWQGTYYKVGMLEEQLITVNGQQRKFFPYKWTGNGVNFQNEEHRQTGVVFTSSDATATAVLKGQLMSNDQNGISSGSQRKLVRTDNGIYHCVYESMGEVWYTHSLTSNFNGSWSNDQLVEFHSKNPSIDYEGNTIKVVYETTEITIPWSPCIYMRTFVQNPGGLYEPQSEEFIAEIPLSYFGSAKPVIAYNDVVVLAAYRKNITDGIYQKSKWYVAGNWQWGNEGLIPNTNSYSSNPSIVGRYNWVYLAWQHSLGIRYIFGYAQGANWIYNNYAIISTGSGYTNNYSPSISLAKNAYPVVSWIGYNYVDDTGWGINKIEGESPTSKIVVRRGSSGSWSSFFKAGYNPVTTNNNSTSSSLNEESVITWSEGTSPNYSSKWVRRVDGSYTDVQNLSHNGKQNQASNGTNLENMKGTVFSITNIPYMLSLSTTNFNQQFGGGGITKVGELIELSYGREGVIYKNGVEFLFNIGDIIVGDSVIKFIEQPDTILYSSSEELNSVVKTVPFYLSPSTEFYFTDFYYVLNDSLADTALTANDMVNFKVELVKEQTGQVVGTFDNITYTKEHLDKYANVSYQVNCSNISPGEYYLRLVTTTEGSSEYFLGNVQNSGEGLDKKKYTRINFDGTTLPVTYSLEQNYPNPFNPATTIRYQIPKEGMVTLKVYDILGAEVATLVDAFQNEGRYEVNFDAGSLASGVYIYRLSVNDFVNVKKMVMLK